MDEQRAWIRSRRKKRLRFTAALLAFSLLVTNYPDIMATFSSYAQENSDGAAVESMDAGIDTAGTEGPADGDETPVPDGEDSGSGEGTPDDGDGTQTPGSEDSGNGGNSEETPDDGDGTQTSEGGEAADSVSQNDGGQTQDGTELSEDDLLADIDIDSLPDTEEAWAAYLNSLDEETRAIVEPMEVFDARSYDMLVPAAQYAGTDGFARQHKMRVVWVNDPDKAIKNTALSSSCSKSYVCVRVPDKGGTQVKKGYFTKDILTDKSGKETVLCEFTLPDTYAEGEPFPTDLGMYSAISMLVGKPTGEIRLQIYDYIKQEYNTYYSIDLVSGGAVLGGVLSKEQWLSDIGTRIKKPKVSLGYQIYEQDAQLRLKAEGNVTRRFGVSLADNYGVALPYEEGDWTINWSLGSFPTDRYPVSIIERDSGLSGVTLEAGPEAGAANLVGIPLYARAEVTYGRGGAKGFSFPIRLDSEEVVYKVKYAGADGSYIRTDEKVHGRDYTIKSMRGFWEVDDAWKLLFDGTYTGTDGKTYRVGEAYTGNASLGLFPNWTGSYVTLTLDATVDQNGQTSADLAENGRQTIRTAVGEKYQENTPVPAKAPAGYEFAGWYTRKAGKGKRYFDGAGKAVRACDLLEDTTLYAGWRAQSGTTVYRLDAGLPADLPMNLGGLAWTEYEIRNCQAGDTLAKKGLRLPEEEKDEVWYRGYRLEGWYTEKTGGSRITNTTPLPVGKDSYTFYARWELVKCIMTYDANGGAFDGGMTKTVRMTYGEPYGAAVTDAPVPVRSGYQFRGYGLYRGALTPLTAEDKVFSLRDFKVYAIWATGVTVNLDPDGGALAAGQSPSVKGLTGEIITIRNPVRTGHTFTGWKNGNQSAVVSYQGVGENHNYMIPDDAGASVTLKAAWQPNPYHIAFQKNAVGAAGNMERKEMIFGVSADLPACAYTRKGYVFAGWNTQADGSGTAYPDRAAVKDLSAQGGTVSLYAQWSVEQYTVRFDAGGGSLAAGKEKKTVTFGNAYGELPVPVRAKYTFLGWYTGKTDGNPVTKDTKVTTAAGHTLYAHWDYDYFTLSFDLRGGSAAAGESFGPREIKKTGGNLPGAEPVLAGLVFGGWSRTAGGAAAYQKGGEIKWQDDGTAEPGRETMTLYAVWTTNDPHVAYDPNCSDPSVGNMPQLQKLTAAELEKGEVTISDQTPTRTGYTFKGWARTAVDGTSLYQPGETVKFEKTAGSLTLYAVWEQGVAETVTLTLKDGDKTLSSAVYPKKIKVTLPGVGLTERVTGGKLEKFTGWSTASGGSVTYQQNAELTLQNDMTLYAVWQDISSCECKWRASETADWTYGTLAQADAALTSGEAVMLKDKKESDGYINLTGGYTLNLNGKTLSGIEITGSRQMTICNGALQPAFYINSAGDDGAGLTVKNSADATLRDVGIKANRDAEAISVYDNAHLTLTGNTYITCTKRINVNIGIFVHDYGRLTVEYAEIMTMVCKCVVMSANATVEIKDGFFYNSYDTAYEGYRHYFRVITEDVYEAAVHSKLEITGGCFANRFSLNGNGNLIVCNGNSETSKGLIYSRTLAPVQGEKATGVSTRYGNISEPANGWSRIAGTGTGTGPGTSLPDIWEINGNTSTKKAPENADMQTGDNTFRLVSASGKSDGAVSWTKSGSRAAVDLSGYTYEVNGAFTMTGGVEENGSIRNGALKAGGTAAFQKTHIASNMVVKANRVTLAATDTIEAGARFYAKNEMSTADLGRCYGDVVLVKQAESDDSSYTHYYVATPWETSGRTARENVTFRSNYPADSGQAAGAKTQEQTRGTKWVLPTTQFTTPAGFTFYEWNTKADGTGSRITADVVYDSAVKEVYAVWKRNNVTATFDLNGGGKTPAPAWMEGSKESRTRLVPYNYEVGNPPAAKRTGYTLEGWYTTSAATGGTKITSATKVTGNTTYYARWKEAEGTPYTVKYRIKGTTNLLGQKEFYGKTGAAVNVNTIKETFTGYTYSGWDGGSKTIAADGSTVVTLDYVLKTSSVRVTVKERAADGAETALSGVSVSITGGGTGSGTPSTNNNVITKNNCAYGSTVTLAAGEKTGYEFVEWTGAQSGSDRNLSFVMSDAAVEVTAVYRKKSYPAAYDLTDMKAAAPGGGTAQGNVTHGGTLTVTLKADEGYELPQAGDITVTVGGQRRTLQTSGSGSDTYIRNDDNTATLAIRNVTGAVNVTAAGVPKDYDVRFLEKKASGQTDARISAALSTGGALPAQARYGTSCTVVLSAAEGYELPENIAVYTAVGADGSGGLALRAGTDYHYDNANGTVYLTKVTGNIRIEAGAVPGRDTLYLAEYYQMDENGSYEEAVPCETEYLTGETGTAVDVDALAGQRSYDGYTYDKYTWSRGGGTAGGDDTVTGGAGTPVIAADGSTVVKLYYKRDQHTVTVKTQTKAPDGSLTWTDWDGMDAAGAANPYYYRGSVDMDLSGLPERKGYDKDGWAAYDTDGWTAYESWAKNPGTGEAPASRFRGKVMRIAIRMPDSDLVVIPVYTPQRLRVSDEGLIHAAFAGEPEAWYEQPFTAELEADSGYSLPDTVTVTIGEGAEETALADGDFTYDKDTGRVEITAAEKVTGTITIHAEAERQERTQTVFLRYADGLTEETSHLRPSRETGAYPVTYNGRFSLTLTPEKGYALPETLSLMAGVDADGNGGTLLTAGADGTSAPSGTKASYDRETGMLSVLAIRDDVLILIPEAQESSAASVLYTVEHYRADEDGGYALAAFICREAPAGTAITEELRKQEQKDYTGYTYVGYEWETGSGAGGDQPPIAAADGSTVIRMYYDIAEYVLTVAMEEGLHGGVSGQGQTGTTQTYRYHYGDSIELELTGIGTGKSFKGWHTGGEILTTGWHYAFTMPAEDLTVTAKSGAGSYELTAYGSHGKAQIPDEEEEGYLSRIPYETAETVTIIPDAHYSLPEQVKILVDDGERQVGMEKAGSRDAGDGAAYVSAQDGKSGEITLTVRGDTAVEFEMVPDQYELTLDPTGGTLEQTTRSITYGEPYGELPVPERKGYDFLGWYSAAEGGTKVEAETALLQADDHTLYAQWKKRPVREPDEKKKEPLPEEGPGGEKEGEAGDGTGSAPGGRPKDTQTPEGRTEPEEAGKAVLDGEDFVTLSEEDEAVQERTGNEKENAYDLGAGRITVEVNCAQEHLTAYVPDTAAVVNSVLSAEQKRLAQNGQSIRIRIDVTDISEQVPPEDRGAIEAAMEAYREEKPQLTVGMYVDISLFIQIGDSGWEAVTETGGPVEVTLGVPEKLADEGRVFYIIRAHDGECTFMEDLDEAAETITIRTDRFSSYAVLYEQTEESGMAGTDEREKCGLCHICPTFLGICYFIWLAVIIAVILIVILILRRKKEKKEEQEGQR